LTNGAVAKDEEIGWTRGFSLKTLDQCSGTHVVAAFDSRLDNHNGAFLEDGNLATEQVTASIPEDVEKLWILSEQLSGQTFSY
jgi:hypothetical protein